MGTSFDRVIEAELDAALAVIVVWSESAVESDWVRSEAEEGLQRNVLVPVRIDDVRLPLAFRRDTDCRLQTLAARRRRIRAGFRAESNELVSGEKPLPTRINLKQAAGDCKSLLRRG